LRDSPFHQPTIKKQKNGRSNLHFLAMHSSPVPWTEVN
jgi:hypothetical protein